MAAFLTVDPPNPEFWLIVSWALLLAIEPQETCGV